MVEFIDLPQTDVDVQEDDGSDFSVSSSGRARTARLFNETHYNIGVSYSVLSSEQYLQLREFYEQNKFDDEIQYTDPLSGADYVVSFVGPPSGVNNGIFWTASVQLYGRATEFFRVEFFAGENGSIAGESLQIVESGESASPVTAVPDSNYQFFEWDDGNSDNPRVVSDVSEDVELTAEFILNPESLFDGGLEGDVFEAASDFMWEESTRDNPVPASVSAVNSPLGAIVGLRREMELLQPTSGARPILGVYPRGGIRNLFTDVTDAFTTRTFTTRAASYTLSFTGAGTVTLSGTSTDGPLIGTGEDDRVSLTFTPTAGTLTLTVSGDVSFAQIEFGSVATAYQTVLSANNIQEPGVPNVITPYFSGTQWLNTGVQSFGTASLFADAGQRFTDVCVVRGLSKGLTVGYAKAGTTLSNRTWHALANPTTGRLSTIVRGTLTNPASADLTDGGFHFVVRRWNGSQLDAVVDNDMFTNLNVGTASEESENITFSARTQSNPAAQWQGQHPFSLLIDRDLTDNEIAQLRNYCARKFGSPA